MTSLRIRAPAKLNFFLHITGKRADGYHLIESLAGFTEFGDMIELSAADDVRLSIEGPTASQLDGNPEDNLVLKAARALQNHSNIRMGAQIILHKHIPLGAGLGGGSSDAAATLGGLLQLWNLSIPAQELYAIALTLGSDIPVCLTQKPAWMSGVGERITPVHMAANTWILLVNPAIPLLTADVYRHYSAPFSPESTPITAIRTSVELVDAMQSRHNALETPAIGLLPVIADILAQLRATAGCHIARMSGSGATCYGLYDSQSQAEHAAQLLQNIQPGWWVQVTQLLNSLSRVAGEGWGGGD